jgi:hypothetical protein
MPEPDNLRGEKIIFALQLAGHKPEVIRKHLITLVLEAEKLLTLLILSFYSRNTEFERIPASHIKIS